mmetsp:Transcript_100682/g.200031  ORF Transcript_100682/g.200031 Transcript_100682/m.200031 type:complete len:271 (+) Transcript_100682:468-1280(+)
MGITSKTASCNPQSNAGKHHLRQNSVVHARLLCLCCPLPSAHFVWPEGLKLTWTHCKISSIFSCKLRTMRSTAMMSLRLGSPRSRFRPSTSSSTPMVPLLSGSRMSERYLWSCGSISRLSSAETTALSSLRTRSNSCLSNSIAVISSITLSNEELGRVADQLASSGPAWSINTSSNVHRCVAHRSSSSSLILIFFDAISAATARVACTNIAEITLKTPITTRNMNALYTRLHSPPWTCVTCSKSGVPDAVVQSPKLHRKTVNIDRGKDWK